MLTPQLKEEIAERKQELLRFLRLDHPASLPPPIQRRNTTEVAPLSFAQERLWFLEQLEPGAAVYNVCRAYRLRGSLNVAALESSFKEIVRRHEVLRSSIRVCDHQPVQAVEPPYPIKLPVVDLQDVSPVEREPEIQQRIQKVAETPFDFAAGQFLRAQLLRLAGDEHVLILATHHIVSDAWSLGILTHELWSLYAKHLKGEPFPEKEVVIQYADFAIWQRDWLKGQVMESQLSYWKRQLANLPVLDLPADRPHPMRQSFYGRRVAIALSESLTSSINELSNRYGVTPFMTLLAAFQILLSRCSGQEDVVVGSPIANRRRTELEELLGLFANTLVLRSDLSGNPTFEKVVERIREVCLAAYAHQDLPFEKLVHELQPERDQSRNPLFQVIFALQNATKTVAQPQGLQVDPIDLDGSRSQFDLSLFLRERNGKYIGYFEYSTDLFNRDRIERMAGHFRTLLEGIIADPAEPISTLPILTASERHQIIVEWNDTTAEYPKDKCIHTLFEEQVERTPEAVALEYRGRQLTYRELNSRANQLAHCLTGLGVRVETFVAICVDRTPEMIVGLLGVLKAGAAYVPLDSAYPKERLRLILEDAHASVIVTQRQYLDACQLSADSRPPRYLCIDCDWPSIDRESTSNPNSQINPGNLAYMIYTSGSTGRPKGVSIEHRNTVNLLFWAGSVYGAEELAGVVASTSICFDLSVFELFVPLCWGGKVFLIDDILQLPDLRNTSGLTLINTVPSAMSAVLSIGTLPRSVRTVNLAGEPLRRELVQRIYELGTVTKGYDLYAPSETTTYSTFTLQTADGPNTIGRPIANTQIYILDDFLQLVPVGVAGELYIGGDGVARGYWNNAVLTAERFIENHFSESPDARLYRTGDRAGYTWDGEIVFFGRTDHQVKIRGYRVELGEIEAILSTHPAIEKCAVVLQNGMIKSPDPLAWSSEADNSASGAPSLLHPLSWGEKAEGIVSSTAPAQHLSPPVPLSDPREYRSLSSPILVAYYTAEAEPPKTADLRIFLEQRVPSYMVPSWFVCIDSFPLTENGKLDRSALSLSDRDVCEMSQQSAVPGSEIEQITLQIWRDVLGVANIGTRDNFFALGGHSLAAVQVIARLGVLFNRNVPVSALFSFPTITDMSGAIGKLLCETTDCDVPTIVRVPRGDPFPLSYNQEHLWRLSRIMPATHFFNIPRAYRFSGDLNIEALHNAIEVIICRHEALRTVFSEVGGCPVQMINSGSNHSLDVVDLRNVSLSKRAGSAADLIFEARQVPFDLSTGPLLATKLLRLTDADYIFLVTIHHIVADYWSMRIFQDELVALYNAFRSRKLPGLLEPPFQFADYACWERRQRSEVLESQLRFWLGQLNEPPPGLVFKSDFTSGNEGSRIQGEFVTFDPSHLEKLKAFVANQNTTPFIFVLTVLTVLLYLHTREREIRIGVLAANRHNQSDRTFGYFNNTLVIRTLMSEDLTLDQLLGQIRLSVLNAMSHQELPFEVLLDELERRGIDRCDVFQVLVNYQFALPLDEVDGATFALLDEIRTVGHVPISTYDMVLNFMEASDLLSATVSYRTDACDELVMQALKKSFVGLSEAVLLRTTDRLSSFREVVQTIA